MKPLLLLLVLVATLPAPAMENELRIWRGMGTRVRATFEHYDGGVVTLKKEDGTTLQIRFESLTPRDRDRVVALAGDHATGSIPGGQIEKPSGRRDTTWERFRSNSPWPETMHPSERKAVEHLGRGAWKHAETQYFIVHFQQEVYARQVGKMADFFYEYIAADLKGFTDRMTEKSHIVVVQTEENWTEFLKAAATAPEWAAAYVHGPVMFLQDVGRSRDNADVLAHEMTHLVLNRFFRRPPPLWLNEGLAEWYGGMAWKSYRRQFVNPGRNFREDLVNPMPLASLLTAEEYPPDVPQFYRTSKYLVGFLQLERDTHDFVTFLSRVTVDGEAPLSVIQDIYGFPTPEELEAAFLRFAQ